MFARFVLDYVSNGEERAQVVGVGFVSPSGVCVVDYFKADLIGRQVGEVEIYSVGIAKVVDIVEESEGVDLRWVDTPEGSELVL